ncbi:LolA family protein [Acinetobacter johnsonii]|uniref:LolA family protein n=1 Tax=Acinetobacter johnsonii TaxID=40214 RepID=UPI003C7D76B3
MIRYKFSKPILVACTASVMTLLAPTVNAQNTELKQVFAQLGATPVVRAQFEQQKKLTALNKTYVSKGTVLFSKNQGVLWQIQSPVKADLVVTPRKLVQKTQRTSSQIEVDKTPYGSVATMFLQLMSGNEAALAKNFNVVSANYSPAQWNVSLTPKSSLFKKLFVQVDAQGQRYVDRITILEQANNRTIIRFSQQTAQPQTLTAAENVLFQLAK